MFVVEYFHRSTKYDHVKGNLIHMLYWIQNIGQIPLGQFEEVILDSKYKKTLTK
jgi:hypothetical protein